MRNIFPLRLGLVVVCHILVTGYLLAEVPAANSSTYELFSYTLNGGGEPATSALPVKVTTENGPIQPGDLLTTSSLPGHAMRAEPVVVQGIELYQPGTILGKALEPLDQGTGLIGVLITLD